MKWLFCLLFNKNKWLDSYPGRDLLIYVYILKPEYVTFGTGICLTCAAKTFLKKYKKLIFVQFLIRVSKFYSSKTTFMDSALLTEFSSSVHIPQPWQRKHFYFWFAILVTKNVKNSTHL